MSNLLSCCLSFFQVQYSQTGFITGRNLFIPFCCAHSRCRMVGRFLYTQQLKLHEKVIPCITIHQEHMRVAGKNWKITYAEIFYGICTGIHIGSGCTLSYLEFSSCDPRPFSRISSSAMTFVELQSRVSIYLISSKELVKSREFQDILKMVLLAFSLSGFFCFAFFLIKILLSFP